MEPTFHQPPRKILGNCGGAKGVSVDYQVSSNHFIKAGPFFFPSHLLPSLLTGAHNVEIMTEYGV